MKLQTWIAGLVLLAVLTACQPSVKSGRGFRLPDGDSEKGKQAFVDLKCCTCHPVAGVALPAPTAFDLPLGGETTAVKTYGELVTSIINPSHIMSPEYKAKLANEQRSPMPDFSRTMTVEQMINLVAFLEAHYTLIQPETTRGHYYP